MTVKERVEALRRKIADSPIDREWTLIENVIHAAVAEERAACAADVKNAKERYRNGGTRNALDAVADELRVRRR